MTRPDDRLTPPADDRGWLDSFGEETLTPQGRSAPPIRDADPSVSLSELKTLNVEIHWFEAVAIVQALCVELLKSSDRLKSATLDLSSVFVGPAGQVHVVAMGTRTAPSDIHVLGTILSGILPDLGRPVGLAGILSNATGSGSFYRSLGEFSEALAYFERPNRASLVKAVYDRWRRSVTIPFAQTPEPVLIASGVPEPAPTKTNKLPRDVPWRWVAVAVVTLAIAIAAAYFFRAGTPPVIASLPVLRSITTVPGAAFDSAAGAVGRALGLSSTTDHGLSSATDQTPPAGPAAPAEVQAPRPRPRPSAPPVAPVAPVANQPPDSSPRQASPPPARAVAAAPEPPPPQEPVAVADSSGDRAPDVTYSARDREVTPPAPVPPQRLGLIPPGVADADLVTIEVLVNARGTVDAVKALARPRTLGESVLVTMGLSAAKSWRFYPALKDGEPVRYLTSVPITPR